MAITNGFQDHDNDGRIEPVKGVEKPRVDGRGVCRIRTMDQRCIYTDAVHVELTVYYC